jgi:hypothetical protein
MLLIVEDNVVHLPKAALPRGAVARASRDKRSRMNRCQWMVSKCEPDASRLHIRGPEFWQCRPRELRAKWALKVRELNQGDARAARAFRWSAGE